MNEATDKLTLEQKRDFYRDGFLVLKKVIPDELVEASLDRIKRAIKGENLDRKSTRLNSSHW